MEAEGEEDGGQQADGCRQHIEPRFSLREADVSPQAPDSNEMLHANQDQGGSAPLQSKEPAITFNPSRFRGRVRAAREVVEVSLRSDDRRSPSANDAPVGAA